MSIGLRKAALIGAIVLTAAAPMAFVQFDEPTTKLQVYKGLAKTGALCGSMLLVWQFLLGFRQIVGKAMRDLLWVLGLHKIIGRYALCLVALHPVFITLYYLERKGVNPLLLQGGASLWTFVLLGQIALALFLLVVVTSVFVRRYLDTGTWYGLHLAAYLGLPLLFAHSLPIGMTLLRTPLGAIWLGLAAMLAGFHLFRLLAGMGLFSRKHVVVEVKSVGPDVAQIVSEPRGRPMQPELGQFVYFRRGFRGPTRPFTVSHYDAETGRISVTVKALGKGTTALQSIEPGETVYLDGPYGVFAHVALQSDRPLVMIAGGIGITPFRRIFQELAYEPGREVHLFYGNRRRHEVVYEEELDDVETVERIDVTHVISDDPHYPGERGFITVDLMRKYLERELTQYEFLICGPPVMTEKLEEALSSEGVPAAQIHHELFSY